MIYAKLGAFLMMIGVVLGAFGAHALRDHLTPSHMEAYKTAVAYQFCNALGLIAIAWLSEKVSSRGIRIAGWIMFAGILVFSGSLVLLALTGIGAFGAVTPVGGALLISAWFLVFVNLR